MPDVGRPRIASPVLASAAAQAEITQYRAEYVQVYAETSGLAHLFSADSQPNPLRHEVNAVY